MTCARRPVCTVAPHSCSVERAVNALECAYVCVCLFACSVERTASADGLITNQYTSLGAFSSFWANDGNFKRQYLLGQAPAGTLLTVGYRCVSDEGKPNSMRARRMSFHTRAGDSRDVLRAYLVLITCFALFYYVVSCLTACNTQITTHIYRRHVL